MRDLMATAWAKLPSDETLQIKKSVQTRVLVCWRFVWGRFVPAAFWSWAF